MLVFLALLQTATAMCTVLSTTLTRVPNGVLRSKFVGSVQLLSKLAEKHKEQVCLQTHSSMARSGWCHYQVATSDAWTSNAWTSKRKQCFVGKARLIRGT
jgi:hypothetical protein